MAKKDEGKPAGETGRGKRPPTTEAGQPAATNDKAARARIRAAELRGAYKLTRDDARRELREHAALWVAGITFQIGALVDRLQAVHEAARPGSLLGEVISAAALTRVLTLLETAETNLPDLRARCGDAEVTLPDLVGRSEALELGFSDEMVAAIEAEKATGKG